MDLPVSVLPFPVSATVIQGLADSTDAGGQPDAAGAVGKVTFTTSLTAPITILPEQFVLVPPKIVCAIDAAGTMHPPENGMQGAVVDEDGTLVLFHPKSPGFSVDFTWSALFEPAAGQTWQSFRISDITADADVAETTPITTLFPTSLVNPTQQALVFFVDVLDPNNLPGGYRVGVDILIRKSDLMVAYTMED